MRDKLEKECPFMVYVKQLSSFRGQPAELYGCTLTQGMLGAKKPSGRINACCLPSQGGKCEVPLHPEADPTKLTYVQRCYRVGLVGGVIDWKREKHEERVKKAREVLGVARTEELLLEAIKTGLSSKDATRLKVKIQ